MPSGPRCATRCSPRSRFPIDPFRSRPMPSLELPAGALPAPAAPRALHALRFLGRGVSRTGILLVLAVLWEVLPRTGLADPTFLPSLSEVLAAGWDLARD